MDNSLDLLLTLQLRAIGYDIFDQVAMSIANLNGQAGLLAAGAAAATLGLIGMAAAAAGFAAAGVSAGEFNTSMVETANNANMTDAQLQQMSQTTLDLSRNTGLATSDIANGYMHIHDEGFNAAGATQVATAAAESAAATGSKFSDVANVLALTLHDWGLGGEYAAQTMDTLHVASADSNVTLDQFTTGMRLAAPMAAAAGVGIDQTAAALATMTQAGFTASQAGTQFKSFIDHIIAPTAGAEKAIQSLSAATGVDLVDDFTQAGLATKGLNGVLGDIAKATNGDIQVFADLTGQSRLTADQLDLVNKASHGDIQAMQTMIPATRGLYAEFILTSSGAGAYKKVLDDIAAAHLNGGVTAQNFARWEDTLGAQIQLLQANVHVAAVEIGENFTPILSAVVKFLIDDAIPVFEMIANAISSDVLPIIQRLGEVWAQLVAGFQSGNLMSVLGNLLGQLATFAGSMFSAGVNLVEQLGAGMMQAAETVIQSVINEITSMIASFFIGASPPPKGALANIDKGGKAVIEAWVSGAQQGLSGLTQVADSASMTLAAIPNKANIAGLENDVISVKNQVLSLRDAGAAVSDQLAQVATATQSVKDATDQLNNEIQDTKTYYEDLISPLQDQLTALQNAVDYQQQLADDAAKLNDLNLQQTILQNSGDPATRARLQNDIESLNNQKQMLSTQAQIADIQNKKTAAAGDPEKLASLDLELKSLQDQKQLYDMQNNAITEGAKQQLAVNQENEKAQALKEQIAAQAKKEQEDTLKQQIDGYKQQEAAAVAPLNAELTQYKRIQQALDAKKADLSIVKTEIGAAATQAGDLASKLGNAATAAKGLSSGGFGGFPKTAPVTRPAFDPNAVAAPVDQAVKSAIETATADAVSKAQDSTKAAVTAWVAGFRANFQSRVGEIGTSIQGALIGAIPTAEAAVLIYGPRIIAAIRSTIEANWPQVSARLSQLFNQAFSAASAVVGHALSGLGTAISGAIGPQNMEILHQLGDGFIDLGTRVQGVVTALEPIGNAITTSIAPAIAGSVVPALQSFVKFLGDAFSAAVQLIGWFQDHQTALDALKSVLMAIAVIGISAMIWALVAAVGAVVAATWAWVAGLAAAAIAELIALAPIILVTLAIAALVFGIMELVKHQVQVGQFFNGLKADAIAFVNAVGENFSQLGSDVHGTLDTITGDISKFITDRGNDWTNFWNAVGATVNNITGAVETTVIGWITQVQGGITGFISTVQQGWTNFWTAVGTTASTWFSTLQQTFTNGLTGLLNTITNNIQYFKQRIQDFLSAGLQVVKDDLHFWMDIGTNIVNAVAGGIRNAAAQVASAAASMVSGAVNAAKGALGIHSPSTVFTDIGSNTAEGFALGIEGGAGRVQGAVGAMLGTPTAVAPAGGGSGPGLQVVINNPTFLNSRDMDDLVTQIGDIMVRKSYSAFSMVRS